MRSIWRCLYCTLIILSLVAVPTNGMATYSQEMLMFEPDQFRQYITAVLTRFEEHTGKDRMFDLNAVELLMLTAAQETHLGRYMRQVRGPAMGAFQIEPATLADVIRNYLAYRPEMSQALRLMGAPGIDAELNMVGNLAFQICVARIIYRRVPEALPDRDDVQAMAEYWKKYWNTELGKGTVEEAIKNYKRFVTEG